MKPNKFRDFFIYTNHFKFYLFLFSSIAFGLIIGFSVFDRIKLSIINSSIQNQTFITKSIQTSIQQWIEQRSESLEYGAKYIVDSKLFDDKTNLGQFLNYNLKNKSTFDYVQIFVVSDSRDIAEIFADDFIDWRKTHINPLKMRWFIDTIEKERTTIRYVSKHAVLGVPTINICTPLKLPKYSNSVICGVIKANSLVDKFKFLNISNTYFFLTDESLQIMTDFKDKTFQLNIQNILNQTYRQNDNINIILNKENITLYRIDGFDWYVGVGSDINAIISNNLLPLKRNSLFFLIVFVVIVVIINIGYEMIIRHFEKEKLEYEKILSHRSKITEIGENIGAINHQLKQPINSLSLFVSNAIFMIDNNLSDKINIRQNYLYCQESIENMSKIIDTFMNFYKNNDSISKLDIAQIIKDILHILSLELSTQNIIIDTSEVENITIDSIPSFVYQVLLVFIQNSKDAIKNSTDKTIKIKATKIDKSIKISITDHGYGVSPSTAKLLFHHIYTTKINGSGLGLFFAHRLVTTSLKGEIEITSRKNPTIFTIILSDLNQNNI